MSPTRTTCQPPVTCWTFCYRKTLGRAPARPPRALVHPDLDRDQDHFTLDLMAVARQEVALVSLYLCSVVVPKLSCNRHSLMHFFLLVFLMSGSSNTSKYFGSIDSSENDHTHKPASGDLEGEQFMKFVLQDPIWLLMANTDDKVMMTYQIPIR